MRLKFLILFLLLSAILIVIFAQKRPNNYQITTNDDYNYIAINECLMWVSNNGDGSHDPRTNGGGFYWPGGITASTTVVWEDGLIWCGLADDELRANGNTHRQGLQAGKILESGVADDPSLDKYRVYKIRRDWELLPPGLERDAYEKDYHEWPIEDGAPWIDINKDGIFTRGIDKPEIFGDETLWFVANDLDTNRVFSVFGSKPIGIEVQVTIFAFKKFDYLGNVIFKKYKLINKNPATIKNMYLGYWSDTDIGHGGDELLGCDTLINLGYAYGDSLDEVFGPEAPAVGYQLLQGPIVRSDQNDKAYYNGAWINGYKNLNLTSFYFILNATQIYRDPWQGNYQGTVELYNIFQGKFPNGEPFIDPNTDVETKFILAGDPVNKSGWYYGEGWPGGPYPGNLRQILSTGSFNFEPGDTQEVVIGILVSQGEDNIQSVAELKKDAAKLHEFYRSYKPEHPDSIFNAPENYYLGQNYPNPFNSSTSIKYSVLSKQRVTINVYDILGQKVGTILDKEVFKGTYKINFKTKDLASGIYIYRLTTKYFCQSKKMILLR